jgi:hypothetical protein
MPSTPSSESLKKQWANLKFFPTRLERALARIWPITALLIFSPLVVVPLFKSGSVREHLADTIAIFQGGFISTLFGACVLGTLAVVYWQRSMRSTFGTAVEAGFVRDDEECLIAYSKLSAELPRLMGSYWRYVLWLALLIVVALANQGPLLQAVDMIRSKSEDSFLFCENVSILSTLFLLSYSGGVVLWSLLASAIWMSRFSKSSCLQLQPGHSDNCCGLSDVGLSSLHSVIPLLVGMVLLALWAFGANFLWFLNSVNGDFLHFIQKYIFGLLLFLFVLAIAQVFLPVSTLHLNMLKVKRDQDREYSSLMMEQLDRTRGALPTGEDAQIKSLSDRLKLVQSFDPVALKLSTWPFDRAVLVTYGITPILTLLTPLVSSYVNRLKSAEIDRPVLTVTLGDSPQFFPERGWIVAFAKLSNVGKTAALDVFETDITVHSEVVEDLCFSVDDQTDTKTKHLTILPGASETLSYVVVIGSECFGDFESSDPLPTVTIGSRFSYTDRTGTKGEQEFRTAVMNARRISSVETAKHRARP